MDKQAFTDGFIQGLAEEGYTPQELEDGLEKTAFVWPLIGALAAAGLFTLGAARLGGRYAGRGAAALMAPSADDVEAEKKEELLKKYEKMTGVAKQKALENAAGQLA